MLGAVGCQAGRRAQGHQGRGPPRGDESGALGRRASWILPERENHRRLGVCFGYAETVARRALALGARVLAVEGLVVEAALDEAPGGLDRLQVELLLSSARGMAPQTTSSGTVRELSLRLSHS